MPKKKEILTDKQVAKTYEVVKGFNITLEDGSEKRFDVGEKKPHFVYEKDFEAEDWKALLEMGAIQLTPEAVEAQKELREEKEFK